MVSSSGVGPRSGEGAANDSPSDTDPLPPPPPLGARALGVAVVGGQLALVLAIVSRFEVATRNHLFPVLCVAFGGYLVHAWLPPRARAWFFAALSLGTVAAVLGWPDGPLALAVGGGLVAACYLPVPLAVRAAVVGLAALGLVVARADDPERSCWPVLGSMFMFRMIGYLYELRRAERPPALALTVAFFLPLQNVCFLFFPILDFRTFRDTYRPAAGWAEAQAGVGWIARGLSHLLAYRVVKYYVLPDPYQLADAPHLALFLAANYALYLHVSGYFHVITGVFHLFGFALPPTHHNYFLASGVTDVWRRINIYWKDFLSTVVFFPAFFSLRRWGTRTAVAAAALWAFAATWFLHAYQVFWITGNFPLEPGDAALWLAAGVVVAAALVRDLARARRPAAPPDRSVRGAVVVAAQLVGTFVLVSVFWSLWNTPAFAGYVRTLAADGRALDGAWWVAATLAAAVGLGAAAKLGRDRLFSLGTLPLRWSPVRSAAGLGAALAAVVALSDPEVAGVFGPDARHAVVTLRRDSATPLEAAQAVQGYYEEIADAPVRAGDWMSALEGRPRGRRPTQYGDLSRPAGPLLERELIPGWHGDVDGAPLTVNRFGMRDRADLSLTKPPGVRRLALIGSSVVMGYGVADGEEFPRRFEADLTAARRPGDPEYQVLNFGTGRSFALQRRVTLDKAFGFDPDAVYYFAHQDELLGPPKHLARLVADKVPLPYPCLDDVVRAAGITPDLSPGTIEAKLTPFARDIVSGLYRDFTAACRGRGVLPVWVFLPMPGVREVPAQSQELARLARDGGFVVADLSDWADGYRAADVKLSESDHHANALGHRVIADKLAALVRGRPDLLPAREGGRP